MALLSLAMIAMLLIFAYFFYALVNKEKDEKKKADSKDDPSTEPVLTTEGLRMTKKDQKSSRPLPTNKNKIGTIEREGTSIVSQSSGNSNNSVNININNYSTGSDHKSIKDGCYVGEKESFTESLSETKTKSSDNKEGKGPGKSLHHAAMLRA